MEVMEARHQRRPNERMSANLRSFNGDAPIMFPDMGPAQPVPGEEPGLGPDDSLELPMDMDMDNVIL